MPGCVPQAAESYEAIGGYRTSLRKLCTPLILGPSRCFRYNFKRLQPLFRHHSFWLPSQTAPEIASQGIHRTPQLRVWLFETGSNQYGARVQSANNVIADGGCAPARPTTTVAIPKCFPPG